MEGDAMRRLPLRENLPGQGLILGAMGLTALGVVMVFSTAAGDGRDVSWYYRRDIRQVIFAATALTVLLTLWRLDYRLLTRKPWPHSQIPVLRHFLKCVPSPAVGLLALGVATSVAALMIGYAVGGRLRWLRWGPIGFQPSEILKFAVLIVLAMFLSRPTVRPRAFWRTFVPALAVVAGACALVVTQDFGTAAIIGFSAAVVMLMAGVPWYYFLVPAPAAAGGFYLFVVRSAHRWGRIVALIESEASTHPASYQPRQALISIASGASPAGLGAGVAKHGYLPEDSTDFIFSIICEELGPMGMALVIGLLLVLLALILRTVRRSPDRFGALLAGGLGFLVVLQAAMHIAVNVKWLPPTGISLPLVSAGGTSPMGVAAAMAIIVSVSARARGTEAALGRS
ncbi:hypothetical protein LCGC14_0639970 [marine sediment metagenome]|uniref:peptidoglycan glycosyltransferase n=1 Tax=marine sediment metagenome TaxID=412755 RepID=A0A0F9RIW9_9ZZZZ